MPDRDALKLVRDVVNMGRISNNNTQYCYVVAAQVKGCGNRYNIVSHLNKHSDKFTIYGETS